MKTYKDEIFMELDGISKIEFIKKFDTEMMNAMNKKLESYSDAMLDYFRANGFSVKIVDEETYVYSGKVQFMRWSNEYVNVELEALKKEFFSLVDNELIYRGNYDKELAHYYRYLMVGDSIEELADRLISIRDVLPN